MVVVVSGGTGIRNPTDGVVTLDTRRVERVHFYKTFWSYKPPEFHGIDDPVACMNCLREMEEAFRACDYDESQNTKFGSYMLQVGASFGGICTPLL